MFLLVALAVAAGGSLSRSDALAAGSAAPPSTSTLPPRGFAGTLADAEVQSGWSDGSTQFSGFDTHYRFSKLVFGSGKQGPYTLTNGDAVVKSGEVSINETSPAGANGTCSTTFLFAQTGQNVMLYGDIGSLSRTRAGWRVTISLGVILPGNVTSQDNCGPNDASSGNPFGEPPKISIPIDVSGEINATTGVLTIDATSTTTVGGQQSDHVTGTLRPTCPDPADDVLLDEAGDFNGSSNIQAATNEFKSFVIGIRENGGPIDAQIQRVEDSRSTWTPRYKEAFAKDKPALEQALAGWLAAARCPETRSKLRDLAKSKREFLEQNARIALDESYGLAERAIRGNCGCGGFGAPEK